MSKDIVLVRLTSGEEILAKKVGDNEYEDACIIIPQGAGSLGIMQYMAYAAYKTITFKDEHIMFELTPKLDLVNEYNKVYGSGLITPPAKKILT